MIALMREYEATNKTSLRAPQGRSNLRARRLLRRSAPRNDNNDKVSFNTFQLWLIRAGISPDCHLAQNRIGLYTDFT